MLDLIPIHEPDLTKLKNLCSIYAEQYVAGDSTENLTQYILEEAMQALYGKGIFNVLSELEHRRIFGSDTEI